MRRIDPHLRRRIATVALVCDRTVQRFIDGGRVMPSLAARIEAAIRLIDSSLLPKSDNDAGEAA